MNEHMAEGVSCPLPLASDTCQKFFGRRKGHPLSAKKKADLSHILPIIGLDTAHPGEALRAWIDATSAPLWMEIGFGTGEHLLAQMARHAERRFLGAEAFANGVAGLVSRVPPQDYQRLRIYPDNIHTLLVHMPPASLDGVYILFPDPWPKARHSKRRLVQEPFLQHVATLMKEGAELRIATDVPEFMGFMAQQLHNSLFFTWVDGVDPARPQPHHWPAWPQEDFPLTRYAAKALRSGRINGYMRWRRTTGEVQNGG